MDKLKDLIDFRNAMENGKIVFYNNIEGSDYILDKSTSEELLKNINSIIESLNYIFSIILQDPFATLYSILRDDNRNDSLSDKIFNSGVMYKYELPTLQSYTIVNSARDTYHNTISGTFYTKKESPYGLPKESPYDLLKRLKDIKSVLDDLLLTLFDVKEELEKALLEKGYSSAEEFKEYSDLLYKLYNNTNKLNIYLDEGSRNSLSKEFGINIQNKILDSLKKFISRPRKPPFSWRSLMGLVTKDFIDEVISGGSHLFLISDDGNYPVSVSIKDGGYIDYEGSLLNNYCKWLIYDGAAIYDDDNNILEAIEASTNDFVSSLKKENILLIENIEKKYNIKYDKAMLVKFLENHYTGKGGSWYWNFIAGKRNKTHPSEYLTNDMFIPFKDEMVDFLKLAKKDVIDSNNIFNVKLFCKMFTKHIIEKYPGKQLAEALKIPNLPYMAADITKELNNAFGKDISDNFFKKLQSKEDEMVGIPENENGKINVSGIIDADDVRKLFILNSSISISKPCSFNNEKDYIKNRISYMKNEYSDYLGSNTPLYETDSDILSMIRTIPKDDYINFLSKLEDLLIRQLLQEDSFLQGKSNSLGIIDNLKDNGKPVKDNSILVSKDIIINYNSPNVYNLSYYNTIGDNETYSPVVKFFLLFFDRFNDIFRYFIYFENEKEQFFKNNDLNSIKNSIIKILNFLSSRSSRNQEASLNIIKSSTSLASGIEIFYNGKKATPFNIIANEFKGKDLGSKREYLEKTSNAFQLIHNYKYCNQIENIVKSNAFKKSYMKNIFELQNIAIPLIGNNKISDTFNQIIKVNSSIIPKEYLTEGILNFFKGQNYINSPDDYDKIINNLLGDGSNESIRRVKFVLSIINDYDGVIKWFVKAKPKVPDVFEPNMSTENFRFRVLKDYDPYHFSVGADTGCCQAIGGAGEAAAIDSFINPYAGVLLLEAKTNSSWGLAAQSYFHYTKYDNKKAIILDNIEAGRYKSMHNKDFYKKAYATLAQFLMKKGFDIVACGKDYTKVISENDFKDGSLESDDRHFEVKEHGKRPYTDFDEESFFDLTKPKFDFKENETTGDTSELSAISASILELYIKKYGSSFSKKLLKVSSFLAAGGFKKEARDIISLAVIK